MASVVSHFFVDGKEVPAGAGVRDVVVFGVEIGVLYSVKSSGR